MAAAAQEQGLGQARSSLTRPGTPKAGQGKKRPGDGVKLKESTLVQQADGAQKPVRRDHHENDHDPATKPPDDGMEGTGARKAADAPRDKYHQEAIEKEEKRSGNRQPSDSQIGVHGEWS